MLDQWPYDPSLPLPPPKPWQHETDWRREKPYPAQVVASPRSFEVSEEGEGGFMMLGSSAKFKTYRLTPEAADALGLVPEWHPGHHDEREAEGTMSFSQPWKERELVLPEA